MRSLLLLGLVASFGCGGGGTSYPAASSDFASARDLASTPDLFMAPADLASAPDLATPVGEDAGGGPLDTKLPGVQCNNITCAKGQVCCVDTKQMTSACVAPNACPGSSASFACEGPEDCGGNAKYCCATVKLGGMGLNCTLDSAKAVCAADCPTMLAGCPTTEVFKVCHAGADCAADPGNKNCCELSPGLLGCISDLAKTFTMAKCF
ncbi:MAG: hypothetical protein EXR72_05330 [Myxococcales bacterium]|nr:hypothetical protein [Myxococcales bacterium]